MSSWNCYQIVAFMTQPVFMQPIFDYPLFKGPTPGAPQSAPDSKLAGSPVVLRGTLDTSCARAS